VSVEDVAGAQGQPADNKTPLSLLIAELFKETAKGSILLLNVCSNVLAIRPSVAEIGACQIRVIPVVGSEAKSAAISGTAPRKKPKGEATMGAHLMGRKIWQAVTAGIDQQLDWVVPGSRRLPLPLVNTMDNLPAGFCHSP
jgi:hypothetical protein